MTLKEQLHELYNAKEQLDSLNELGVDNWSGYQKIDEIPEIYTNKIFEDLFNLLDSIDSYLDEVPTDIKEAYIAFKLSEQL